MVFGKHQIVRVGGVYSQYETPAKGVVNAGRGERQYKGLTPQQSTRASSIRCFDGVCGKNSSLPCVPRIRNRELPPHQARANTIPMHTTITDKHRTTQPTHSHLFLKQKSWELGIASRASLGRRDSRPISLHARRHTFPTRIKQPHAVHHCY